MFMAFAAKDNMYLCFVIPKATANLLHSNILSNQSSMDYSLYYGFHFKLKILIVKSFSYFN